MKKGVVVIHGGVSSSMVNIGRRQFMKNLLRYSYKLLDTGLSGINIVEKVLTKMEDSGLFNAGKGSVKIDETNVVQMDASIMDGRTGKSGVAVMISRIKNPIKLAKKIMSDTPYVTLAGRDAEDFGQKEELETVTKSYFEKSASGADTVGVVVLDRNGNLACGSTTGGVPHKMAGRVGDTGVIGAGLYANNNQCAVVCTGKGDTFIKHVVAYDVYARMKYQKISLTEAINKTLKGLPANSGGIVGVDKNGKVSVKYNTAHLLYGYTIDEKQCYLSQNIEK